MRRMTAGSGTLLAVTMLTAQVIPSVVKVSRTGDTWYIQNLTKQAITGYVLHSGYGPLHFNATEINCAPSDWEWQPIEPGATAEILVKPGFAAVDIPALIFADGSVIGAAMTTEGIDVVEAMFDLRRGEAREFARWLKIVEQPNHNQALIDFRHEAQTPRAQATGMEESGRNAAFVTTAGDLSWLEPQSRIGGIGLSAIA